MRARKRIAALVVAVATVGLPATMFQPGPVIATPNPVATDEATYQAFGRVFPDPHGCLAAGVPDQNGDGVKDTPRGVSPWAKGRVCADQFLQYQEVLDGAKFLSRRFPDLVDVIRLDEAYDNANYMSAGLPRMAVNEDGKPVLLGRDRRPLHLIKVTDDSSAIPEADRKHFAYSLSIHGIERAGVEGGIRAMEDLVTWTACEKPGYAEPAAPDLPPPACAVEGPFPKEIVESNSERSVPTAGQVLNESVIYFVLPNPDGWARGQVSPVEIEDGGVNTSYQPGFFFQRYNGNGVDLNRDWPTVGYSFKPYSPGSEPEVKAFGEVLTGIRESTTAGQFTGGIDLHGMLTADAFSYTLIGAGQRDYRKNALTVDTSIRTWEDQTQRMSWSPYVADENANGVTDNGETCLPAVGAGGNVPACVADEWGTVIDTIGYQITGGIGDWFDSPIGLNGIGIDNEMYASHLAPNTVFDPALEQTHIDGNKGLIYSQLASLLTAGETAFDPVGKVGFLFNPKRLRIDQAPRAQNPGLPAQNDIEVTLPCHSGPVAQNLEGHCGGGTFVPGSSPAFEFVVESPEKGFWNGGITVTHTGTNAAGVGASSASPMQLQIEDEGQWHTVAYHYRQGATGATVAGEPVTADVYAPAGQVVTIDDPKPGRYRVSFLNAAAIPGRLKIDFRTATAEANPGQAAIDVSSMDFFRELNSYISQGAGRLQNVRVKGILANPTSLSALDSLVVTNHMGSRDYLRGTHGFTGPQIDRFFAALRSFVESGGNLVLTDGAVQALPELGVVDASAIRAQQSNSETTAGNYAFQISDGLVTYDDPATYPLATDVKKPGTAEQELGRRQAVEPAPIGYSPDYGLDDTPKLTNYGVDRTAFEQVCGFEHCVTATQRTEGDVVNLGEIRLGSGTIRIGGILLPDPVYEPDTTNDHRFGLASYALTYTGWDVFENLIDHRR